MQSDDAYEARVSFDGNTKFDATIGDSYNDLDMVRRFHGFSVLNGTPELKAIARQVLDGIQELVKIKM